MQTLKRRRRARRRMRRLLLPLLLILLAILGLCQLLRNRDGGETRQPETRELSTQERENLSELPERLQDLYNSNPDARRFVLEYTEKKDADPVIDLSEYENCTQVPLLMQWDERWGYKQYGDDFFALNGCGPTCLSMVCLGLGGDTKYDPYTVGTLMDANGYYEAGSGSKWSIMTEGASLIGLYGEEISLDENVIRNTLNSGSPIICSVGEGDFTQSGHFIVLAGIAQDGSVIVNDPCSRINSEQTWELSRIMPQIKNLWAFSLN